MVAFTDCTVVVLTASSEHECPRKTFRSTTLSGPMISATKKMLECEVPDDAVVSSEMSSGRAADSIVPHSAACEVRRVFQDDVPVLAIDNDIVLDVLSPPVMGIVTARQSNVIVPPPLTFAG